MPARTTGVPSPPFSDKAHFLFRLSTTHHSEKNHSKDEKPDQRPLGRRQAENRVENVSAKTVGVKKKRHPSRRPQAVDRRFQRIPATLDGRMRDNPQLPDDQSDSCQRTQKRPESESAYFFREQSQRTAHPDSYKRIALQDAQRAWQDLPDKLEIKGKEDKAGTKQQNGNQEMTGFHKRLIQPGDTSGNGLIRFSGKNVSFA